MAIMKLQNDFTTPEQSKRLLELGVPADSADCQYYAVNEEWGWEKPALRDESKPLGYNCTPCWSTGRLIEIYRQFVFSVELLGTLVLNDDIIEAIVSSMEVSVNKCNIDFSKLEEQK